MLWLSVDEIGELSFSFRDVMSSMTPFYALRLIAGLIFLTGTAAMAYNLYMTVVGRSTVTVNIPAVDPAYGVGR